MWGLPEAPEILARHPLDFLKLSPAAQAERQAMAAPEVTAAPEVMAGQGAIKVEQVRVAVAVPALRALLVMYAFVGLPGVLHEAAVAGEGRALAIQVIPEYPV